MLPFDAAERSRPASESSSFSADLAGDAEVSTFHAPPCETENPNTARNDEGDFAAAFLSDNGEAQRPSPREFAPEPSAKVIEFPRSAAIPIVYSEPLADPIFDRPRIVEAPEVVPPPPAMGGILIEPAPSEERDRWSREDSLESSSSIPRRVLAGAVDGLIVSAAVGAFGAVFLRFNPAREPALMLAAAGCALAVGFWMVYEFVLVVFTGSTPGLRVARLKLVRFDDSPVNRQTRRWRVLASFLSAFSAGLGYLWCFVDQDSLCWHDRITRTHLRRARPAA
jgi:uncharacterized RDD family membrane protein YckC